MNRGNYLGMVFSLILFGFSYYFLNYISLVPSMAAILVLMTLVCFMGGTGILVYSSLFEGNTYIRRRFGGENIGIGILIEQGAFWRFYQINLAKSSATMEGEIFIIVPKDIGFRRGGAIPYVAFLKGTGQSINLQTLEPVLTSKLNTAWLMEESTIAAIMATNMFQNRIFLAAIIGFIGVGILTIIAIFYAAEGDGVAKNAVSVCSQVLDQLQKPTEAAATAIPNA